MRSIMIQIPAYEVESKFSSILSKVKREPVEIIEQGKPVAIVLSIPQYQGMSCSNDDLWDVIHQAQSEAKKNGLTENIALKIANETK